MNLPFRAQLEQIPGSQYLVLALNQIAAAIGETPTRVGTAQIHSGTGAPTNRVTGNIGDLYLRTDGSTSTTLYVKESGTNSKTGWVAK